MNLNTLLEALIAHTAALTAHTAALTGGTSGAAASTAKADAKPAAAAAKTTTKTTVKKGATREQTTTMLNTLKEAFGADEAKALVKDIGGAAKLADVPDENLDALFKAAIARHAELEAGDGGAAGEDDGL